jgi:hypothetical protein
MARGLHTEQRAGGEVIPLALDVGEGIAAQSLCVFFEHGDASLPGGDCHGRRIIYRKWHIPASSRAACAHGITATCHISRECDRVVSQKITREDNKKTLGGQRIG